VIVASGALTVVAVALLVLGLAIRSAFAVVVAVACCLAASGCLAIAVRRRRVASSDAGVSIDGRAIDGLSTGAPSTGAPSTGGPPAGAPDDVRSLPYVAPRVPQTNVLVRPARTEALPVDSTSTESVTEFGAPQDVPPEFVRPAEPADQSADRERSGGREGP
jgi:hypothetical protein